MWVARAGAYGVSHHSPSGSFTLSEPSKEAHDSDVYPPSADARGVPGAARPHQYPVPRATTGTEIASVQGKLRVHRDDGGVVLHLVRAALGPIRRSAA